jgi:hypothetical protein
MLHALPSKASDHSLTGRASRTDSAGTSRLLPEPFLIHSFVVELTCRGLSTDRRLFVACVAGFGTFFTVHASLAGSVRTCFLYISTKPSRLGTRPPDSDAKPRLPSRYRFRPLRRDHHDPISQKILCRPNRPRKCPLFFEAVRRKKAKLNVSPGQVVGRTGLEPVTPCASCKCATSCANGPFRIDLTTRLNPDSLPRPAASTGSP